MSEITLKGNIAELGENFVDIICPEAAVSDLEIECTPPADWHEGQEVTITIRSVEK